MNPSKDLVGSKYLQSPNNYQKQQESTTKVTAKQILSQVPTKNLRNPDYYITSILNNPNAKVFNFLRSFLFFLQRKLI